jgi:hypothetical protein
MQKGLTFLLVLMMVGVGVGLVLVEMRASETGGIAGRPTENAKEEEAEVVSPGGTIPEGWKRYQLPEEPLLFWYPGEMVVTETAGGDSRFLLTGETQTQGTELFDGILVEVGSGTYESDSFEAFARGEYETAANEPATTESGDFGPVNISGKIGYRFFVTGLGTFTHIYIPVEPGRFVRFTYIVADPTGKDYQGQIEAMLASIAYGGGW